MNTIIQYLLGEQTIGNNEFPLKLESIINKVRNVLMCGASNCLRDSLKKIFHNVRVKHNYITICHSSDMIKCKTNVI